MIRFALRRAIDEVERDRSCDGQYTRDMTGASRSAAWPASPITGLLAAALLLGLGLFMPAAAQVSGEPSSVSVNVLTPERMVASAAALVALIAAIIGGLALARSTGRVAAGTGRRGAVVALVLGPIGLIVGGLVVAAADGGLGTGNGLGGGVVAMGMGLIGMTLGGLALARSRRTTSSLTT